MGHSPLRLSIDALVVLDAIARRGSFARAAAELHRVPSALSYTVAQFESALGVRLFDRSGRSARLTPLGQSLLDEGREILEKARALERRVEGHRLGWESELRIAVDTLFGLRWLYALIPAFDTLNTPTRLRLTEEVMEGPWDSLIHGRSDLIVAALNTGAVPGSGVKVLFLGTIQQILVAAPAHALARVAAGRRRPLRSAELQAHRSVCIADSARVLPPRTANLQPGQDTLTVPSLRDKLHAIEDGLGVGFVPAHAAAASLQARRLVALQVEQAPTASGFCVAWRPADAGRATGWFIDQLTRTEFLPGLGYTLDAC